MVETLGRDLSRWLWDCFTLFLEMVANVVGLVCHTSVLLQFVCALMVPQIQPFLPGNSSMAALQQHPDILRWSLHFLDWRTLR